MNYDLSRYINAQQHVYRQALYEIKNGRKQSHWIWYIFPQLQGLGRSSMSHYYGILNLDEAKAYLNDSTLGTRLIEMCNALLSLDNDNASDVMGQPDDMKLKSSMTLFDAASESNNIFMEVLNKFYKGKKDSLTLKMLGIQNKS